MKANEQNLNKFLSQSDTQFIIPVYQRNYDWGNQQCKQFIDDIFEIGSNDKHIAHFIGSIVYIHDDLYISGDISELTIIDGQQRLTTVTLIYLVILGIAKNIKNEILYNKINEQYLINKFSLDSEKLKLRPTENNDRALKHLLRNDAKDEFADFSRIIDNFSYFQSRITEENYEIALKGLNKLMFVEISLDREKDEPQRIFESLNSTGLDLSQADLIRNYILMGLKRKPQKDIYENYWEPIEKCAKDESLNTTSVSEFIRDFLTMENKRIPVKNKVYQEFKEKYPKTYENNIEEALKKIKIFSKYYNKLLNPSKETDKDIQVQLDYIKRLDMNVAYPFLMKVYNDYSSSRISKVTFIMVLELIQSFVWRRFIVNLPTNALNKIFMRLYEDIVEDNYLYSIQYSLLKKKGVQRFPRDVEIESALKEKDIYGIKPKNRFYFLERLENYKNPESVRIEGNKDITVEHIFPQNPDISWKKSLSEEDYKIMKEIWLNTIANLTLSGNNGPLSNKSFSEKRNMNIDDKEQGYYYSRLWLNRFLKDIDHWGLKEINERYKLLKNRFLEIWKIPTIEIENGIDLNEINIFDADDPKGKKLEYAIFMDEKIEITEVAKLYLHVMKTLFDLQPESFFTTELRDRLNLTKESKDCRTPVKLNETYYIESNIDNKGKFERIKQALTIFDFEDELIIKYAEK